MPRNSDAMIARFENLRKVIDTSSIREPIPSEQISEPSERRPIPRSVECGRGTARLRVERRNGVADCDLAGLCNGRVDAERHLSSRHERTERRDLLEGVPVLDARRGVL